MNFPIVKVTTKDGYILYGLLSEPKKKTDTIIIHIHGSAGNFYQSSFYPALFSLVDNVDMAFLSTNNRGTGVYDVEAGTKYKGAAVEIFEECLWDIDAWMEYALAKGYKHIILEGHSFGTNKVQYYIHNGKYHSRVLALILLGFTDSYGGQLDYLKRNSLKNEHVLKEAELFVAQKKPLQLLSNLFINWGELPQTAQSYLSFMSPNSSLSNVLPLRGLGGWENFRNIRVPILGIVGDHKECTVIPPQEAVNILNQKNRNASCFMINGSDHSYTGKEKELVEIIAPFLKNTLLLQ